MDKRLLMITTGYLPYQFSENLCNAKFVYALQEVGYQVDVISRKDEGNTYDAEWNHQWSPLKEGTHIVSYNTGNRLQRAVDVLYSGLCMGANFRPGTRWMRRAYQKALQLIGERDYAALLTRSPSDIPHFIGQKLKAKTGILWIANWNDPALTIWPEPYRQQFASHKQKSLEKGTARVLACADVNTFPSDSLRKHFIKHFPFLATTPTGIVPHIGLSESLITAHNPKNDGILKMVHSGNLSSERNPENLFKAMRQLVDEGNTNFRLDIMGYHNPLSDHLVGKYGLQEYVKVIGSFSYFDAVEKLFDYDVMVLLEAQLEEGIFFASKTTDYALTGKPIFAVSPKRGFAHDMITKYHAGLAVDNASPEAIYGGLKELIERWGESTLCHLHSRELYQEFAPSKVVEDFERLLKV